MKNAKLDLDQLRKAGFTEDQINLLKGQRRTTITLTQQEQTYHTRRFQHKHYPGRCELPMNTKYAAKIERMISRNKPADETP